ncbi:MAG: 2-hydroxyacyl-CoA dehydratase [FCB group bacterium]|nr:2-hydroxyacyl-CoA dehydratase [FCB group bacterium]
MPDKPLIRKLKAAETLRQVMGDYYQRLKNAQDSGEQRVAWCSSVGPAELLYAMDFEVYFPENHAAMIGASKKANQYIPVSVANGYSPDICSYLTSDIGAFLKGETPLKKMGLDSVPRPDILVYNTNQCREVVDWFKFYADHFKVPIVGINTPLNLGEVSPGTVKYISDQYRQLVPVLETVSGRKFVPERFKAAVGLSRDACELWKEVLETAVHRPAPINFFDASIHMGPIVVMRGTSYALEYYQLLLSELKERLKDGVGAVAKEQFRIYWEGMPLWYNLSLLAKLFARLDACVVASTYCNSWIFDDLDPDHPFESSALAYTKLFIVRSDSVKQQLLAEHLDRFSIDGIIYHDAKTCPRNTNNQHGLQVRLHDLTGVPYLEISGDLNDSRCFSREQGIIAIETFLQQIAMDK